MKVLFRKVRGVNDKKMNFNPTHTFLRLIVQWAFSGFRCVRRNFFVVFISVGLLYVAEEFLLFSGLTILSH